MSKRRLVSSAMALCRRISGRRARRVYSALILLCVVLSCSLRFRSYLLTRKIQAVLAGLAQVRVDQTTESQLLKTVPYLVLDRGINRDGGVERYYFAAFSNNEEGQSLEELKGPGIGPAMPRLPAFLYRLWLAPFELSIQNKWAALSLPLKVAYVLGWRHLAFVASVRVLDGVVSGTSYRIEPDVFVGWPANYLVVVRSAHGFWITHSVPVPVASTDDESPDFRFIAGAFSSFPSANAKIGVAYTPSAPRELVSRVFQVDLSCFWGMRGCDSVRQVVPLLWAARQAVVARAAARLASQNPCSDQILTGRVRTLPDLHVVLLNVANARSVETDHEGGRAREIVIDYRLQGVIRGRPEGPWTEAHYGESVPKSLAPEWEQANPLLPLHPKPGDKFLYFIGARFESCRIVPATPSAESAVRDALPATRRKGDEVVLGGRW
jgi:hypothetical protein